MGRATESEERALEVLLVTPAPEGSLKGNRVTAERWARRLGELGHVPTVRTGWSDEAPDLLVALHARRSHDAVVGFRRAHPDRPVVLALTGTDVYGDLERDEPARESIACADRLVTLERRALEWLPSADRARAHVLPQTAEPPPASARPLAGRIELVQLAHLRAVKDPLLGADALRRLPTSSTLRLRHAGEVLEPELGERARAETEANPRYAWLGPLPPADARGLLASAHGLLLTSRSESAANAVVEALVAGVPPLTSAIPGVLELLGDDWPGRFPVGDAEALARLLERFEGDPGFRTELVERTRALAPAHQPAREREAWRALLDELELPRPAS